MRYTTNAERVAAREELVPWLSAAIEGRGRDELVAALRAADVPAGPVASVGEALRDMEAAHGGAWVQEAPPMRLAPDPIRLDGESPPLRTTPPLLGEHTDECSPSWASARRRSRSCGATGWSASAPGG